LRRNPNFADAEIYSWAVVQDIIANIPEQAVVVVATEQRIVPQAALKNVVTAPQPVVVDATRIVSPPPSPRAIAR